MYNASVDPSDTVSFNDLNGNLTQDFAEDSDGNGLIDGIDRWPDFIFRVIDTPATEPISRSAGLTVVAGIPVLLQFITFPPGTLIYEDIPNDPALKSAALMGQWWVVDGAANTLGFAFSAGGEAIIR